MGGASVWAAIIRERSPHTAIEVLASDFSGLLKHSDPVLDAQPDIYNHNVKTVERLQKPVRVTARYDCSRSVLRHAKNRGFTRRSSALNSLSAPWCRNEAQSL